MAAELPNWVPVLQALLTPTIAVAATVIAFLQLYLAWQRLRFDLLDRRLKVFESTRELISKLIWYGTLREDEIRNFRIATSETRFIFDQTIEQYIDDIWGRAVEVEYLDRKASTQADNHQILDDLEAVKKSLRDELLLKPTAPLISKFAPFLKINLKINFR